MPSLTNLTASYSQTLTNLVYNDLIIVQILDSKWLKCEHTSKFVLALSHSIVAFDEDTLWSCVRIEAITLSFPWIICLREWAVHDADSTSRHSLGQVFNRLIIIVSYGHVLNTVHFILSYIQLRNSTIDLCLSLFQLILKTHDELIFWLQHPFILHTMG